MKKLYRINENGYSEGKPEHSSAIHRQVAYKEIYLKNRDKFTLPFSKYVVHHIDGERLNGSVKNLYICTKEQHNNIHNEQIVRKKKFTSASEIDYFLKSRRDKEQTEFGKYIKRKEEEKESEKRREEAIRGNKEVMEWVKTQEAEQRAKLKIEYARKTEEEAKARKKAKRKKIIIAVCIIIVAILLIFILKSPNQQQNQEGYYKIINYSAFCVYACGNLEKLYAINSLDRLGNPPYTYKGYKLEDTNTYVGCMCGENVYSAVIKDVEESFLK